jgi:HK97 gp10 family phage protein
MALKWNGDKVAAEIRGRAERGAIEAAEFLAETARDQAPVRTGELRDSIGVVPGPDRGSAFVVATANHAAPVEWGTYKMSANPFMRRSIAMCREGIRRIIARHVSGGSSKL